LSRLIGAGVIDRGRLTLRFLGPGAFAESAEIAKSIAATNLGDVVEFVSRVDYQECLRQMAESDLLLLLQASDDTTSLVPAKLYEYLRVQRPVLALVRPGAATEVIDSTGGGWCCDPRDSGALERTLRDIVELWKSERLAQQIADAGALRKFDRRALTGQLASILDRVSVTNPREKHDA
jgi:glycosyltransferase involved in cell wall biosynthesis